MRLRHLARKPLDASMLLQLRILSSFVTVEENVIAVGAVRHAEASPLTAARCHPHVHSDRFIEHGSREEACDAGIERPR